MLRRQLLHFALAGSLGFLIDASVTQGLVRLAGFDPHPARIIAIALTIAFTFWYNRRITFIGRGRGGLLAQFGRYLAGNSLGLVGNYAAFAACLSLWPWLRTWPAVAVAAGALVGMGINFVAARYFVFSGRSDES